MLCIKFSEVCLTITYGNTYEYSKYATLFCVIRSLLLISFKSDTSFRVSLFINKLCITTSGCFKCVFLKWLIPLDVVAWRLSLFLWALLSVASESVSNNFGFIRLEKGEIFWKETSKDWNNATIKGPCANWLVNVSFCS